MSNVCFWISSGPSAPPPPSPLPSLSRAGGQRYYHYVVVHVEMETDLGVALGIRRACVVPSQHENITFVPYTTTTRVYLARKENLPGEEEEVEEVEGARL